MDSQERARAARFVRPVHAERYIRFHAATRLVVSMYTGDSPGRIAYLKLEPGEKPALATDGPQFNLSHTGGPAALAVSLEPAGVGIEEIRSITDLESLATRS